MKIEQSQDQRQTRRLQNRHAGSGSVNKDIERTGFSREHAKQAQVHNQALTLGHKGSPFQVPVFNPIEHLFYERSWTNVTEYYLLPS